MTMLDLYNAMVAAVDSVGVDGGATAVQAEAATGAFVAALVVTGPLAMSSEDGSNVMIYLATGNHPVLTGKLYPTLGSVEVPS